MPVAKFRRRVMPPSLHPGTRTTAVVLVFVTLVAVHKSQSFIFDQCDVGPGTEPRRAAGNQTAQECVGQVILDALTKASEDPESFFKTNELVDDGGGTMRLIKLKFDNETMEIDQRYVIDESRSSNTGNFWEQLVDAFKKLANYSSDHGILVSLPQWSRKYPTVSIIDENDVVEVVNEGRGKHQQKKYALLFPLLATFKFIVIKALLVPILAAVMMIKKILVVSVMALPAVIAMVRLCRNNNGFGGFGGGNLLASGAVGPIGQAAAFAPLTADMSGDYSSYVQQAAASSQQNVGGGYKDYSKNLMDAMKAAYKRR